MLLIAERYTGQNEASDRLVLTFDLRQKSRLRVVLVSGDEAALMLPRGGVLRGGDRLQAEDGRVVAVEAAPEKVMRVIANSVRQLAQAAYHLGNRHVPLQVGNAWLLLEADHVLEHMLTGLGVTVIHEVAPFEPETGAYAGHDHGAKMHDHGHHHHGHDHHHDHSHD